MYVDVHRTWSNRIVYFPDPRHLKPTSTHHFQSSVRKFYIHFSLIYFSIRKSLFGHFIPVTCLIRINDTKPKFRKVHVFKWHKMKFATECNLSCIFFLLLRLVQRTNEPSSLRTIYFLSDVLFCIPWRDSVQV